MVDSILTFVVQHYVIVGILSIAAGVLLNLVFTAGPEILQQLRTNKLF